MFKKAFLRRLSRQFTPSSGDISYARAHSVGIITLHEWQDQVLELSTELEREGKSPRVVAFVPQPKKNEEYPPHTFTPKDITLTGGILSDELLYFTKQQYDFLLCFDHTGSDFIKFLLAKTQARHRIGIFHSNFAGHLDMMVKPQENERAVRDLLRYVKMIRND